MARIQAKKYCRRCKRYRPMGQFAEKSGQNQSHDWCCLRCRDEIEDARDQEAHRPISAAFMAGVAERTAEIRATKQIARTCCTRWTVPEVRIGRR